MYVNGLRVRICVFQRSICICHAGSTMMTKLNLNWNVKTLYTYIEHRRNNNKRAEERLRH